MKRPGEALDDHEALAALWAAVRSATEGDELNFSALLAAINDADVVLVWDGKPDPDDARAATVKGLRAEVERLEIELSKVDALCDYWHSAAAPDPDEPPIPCVRVEDTDGRPTWRAMGDDVRTLGGEWERQHPHADRWNPIHAEASWAHVYLVRRTQPAPRTERVPWWQIQGRTLSNGDYVAALMNDGGPWYRTANRVDASWWPMPLLCDNEVEVLCDTDTVSGETLASQVLVDGAR